MKEAWRLRPLPAARRSGARRGARVSVRGSAHRSSSSCAQPLLPGQQPGAQGRPSPGGGARARWAWGSAAAPGRGACSFTGFPRGRRPQAPAPGLRRLPTPQVYRCPHIRLRPSPAVPAWTPGRVAGSPGTRSLWRPAPSPLPPAHSTLRAPATVLAAETL